MKKYCFIIGILFLLSFKSSSGISGKYKIVFDAKSETAQKTDYFITIKEKNYTKTVDGENTEGGISVVEKNNGKKIYYLKDFLFVQNKKVIDTGKLKPMGKVVMEVEEINKDTLNFRTTYDRQLQITINTGKLIRENKTHH
jgi:hypothetical protein